MKFFLRKVQNKLNHSLVGITPIVEILDKYGGWPVIKGDAWESDDWEWLETSRRISNDGLIDLILDCHIVVEPQNSSKRILTVSIIIFVQH